MEPTPFLRPTALQQMRGFLTESGAPLPPWSSSDQVMDELAELLHTHCDDGAFFARLTPFLEELRASAARGEAGLPARDAELLSRATVESMVAELRAQLRKAPRGASASILRSLIGERAAPLLCLALVASGVSACNAPPPPTIEPRSSSPPVEPKKGSPPPTAPGSTDALVEMFKKSSPEAAAKALERAMDAGVAAEPGGELQVIPSNEGGHAKYKGVGF